MNALSRILGVSIGFAVFAADVPQAFAQTSAPIVVAQNQDRPSIFRFLFNKPRGERVIILPGEPVERAQPRKQRKQQGAKQKSKKSQSRSGTKKARAAATPPPPKVEKAADAKKVLVVGDFMAGAAAKGLTEAYAENPNVVVVDRINGSSGLVRDDHYSWPLRLPEIIAEEKPAAVVMMVGANDRQVISTPSGSQALGTDGWKAAYAERIGTVADAMAASGTPSFWVGLVPVRSGAMSRDYSVFNGILRERIETRQGVSYVDVWNGFADEEGGFVASGPDVNGQPTQLRDGDGLNFTRAGQRKLGFFIQQQLDPVLLGAVAAAPGTQPEAEPVVNAPAIGPMTPIDAITSASAEALSSPVVETRGQASTHVLERLASRAESGPPAGRADNFVWQPQQPSPPAKADTPKTTGAAPPPRTDPFSAAVPTNP